MSGGRRRYRALAPILLASLTMLAITVGGFPANAAGARHLVPAQQRNGAYVVAEEQVGPPGRPDRPVSGVGTYGQGTAAHTQRLGTAPPG
jgi:hypothetical protein